MMFLVATLGVFVWAIGSNTIKTNQLIVLKRTQCSFVQYKNIRILNNLLYTIPLTNDFTVWTNDFYVGKQKDLIETTNPCREIHQTKDYRIFGSSDIHIDLENVAYKEWVVVKYDFPVHRVINSDLNFIKFKPNTKFTVGCGKYELVVTINLNCKFIGPVDCRLEKIGSFIYVRSTRPIFNNADNHALLHFKSKTIPIVRIMVNMGKYEFCFGPFGNYSCESVELENITTKINKYYNTLAEK